MKKTIFYVFEKTPYRPGSLIEYKDTGEYVPVQGYEFAIEGIPFRFFTWRNKDGGGWDACEMSTGLSVIQCQGEKTRQEAITVATLRLQKTGMLGRTLRAVERHIDKYGESPATKGVILV